jgi:hypothetical protein
MAVNYREKGETATSETVLPVKAVIFTTELTSRRSLG